jgi:hypothetical protein
MHVLGADGARVLRRLEVALVPAGAAEAARRRARWRCESGERRHGREPPFEGIDLTAHVREVTCRLPRHLARLVKSLPLDGPFHHFALTRLSELLLGKDDLNLVLSAESSGSLASTVPYPGSQPHCSDRSLPVMSRYAVARTMCMPALPKLRQA